MSHAPEVFVYSRKSSIGAYFASCIVQNCVNVRADAKRLFLVKDELLGRREDALIASPNSNHFAGRKHKFGRKRVDDVAAAVDAPNEFAAAKRLLT